MPHQESQSALDTGKATARQLEMDVLVGYILLGGVLLSLVLIASALLWKWTTTRDISFDYQIQGMNLFELVKDEFRRAAHGAIRPRLLITMGITVLLLTPYLRVVASMFYFMTALKNWKYTLFTSVVLLVLTFSLFLR